MKKLIPAILVSMMVFATATVNAETFPDGTDAQYDQENSAAAAETEYDGDAEGTGMIESVEPEPYGHYVQNEDLSTYVYKDSSVTVPAKVGVSDVPSSYDLRDEGRVTSVKDQGNHGFCWAFGTIASFESNLITKNIGGTSINLSEGHLAYYSGHGKNSYAVSKYAGKDSGYLPDDYSNYYVSAATLARRYGGVKESAMPYSHLYASRYHNDRLRVKHTYELVDAAMLETSQTTEKYNKTEYKKIKKLIMQNGAVASMIAYPASEKQELQMFGTNDPSKMKAYYSSAQVPNHAVTVVGWNDHYDRNNFHNKPAGDGAWLMKNSYGDEFNNNGYFWASYYSPSISVFVSFQGKKNSGRQIYQYDGAGVGDDILSADRKVTAANRFKARKDILIDSVGVWPSEAGVKINVKIYVNKDKKSPQSGKRIYNGTFKMKYAGYHTIYFTHKVGVPKGARYSVLISGKTSDGRYVLPYEVKINGGYTVRPAALKRGQSFVKIAGSKWGDMKDEGAFSLNGYTYRLYNANVKVFGVSAGKKAQKIQTEKKKTLKKGSKYRLKVKVLKGKRKLVFSTTNSKKVEVSNNGTIKAKKKGKAKIIVRARPTKEYRSAKKTITIIVK